MEEREKLKEDILLWKNEHPSVKAQLSKELRTRLLAIELPGFEIPREKQFAILNDLYVRPTCIVCGKHKNLFKETCSVKCASNNPDRNEKIKNTIFGRYGVNGVLSIPRVKEKIKEERIKNQETISKKIKETNLLKYGVTCALNSSDIILRKKATWIENYGVDNPGKAETVRAEIKKTTINNANADKLLRLEYLKTEHNIHAQFEKWGGVDVEYKWKHEPCGTVFHYHFVGSVIPRCPTCFPLNSSAEEIKIRNFLELHNINFCVNDRTIIKPREIDIFIPEAKLGIEINGAYWHHDGAPSKTLLEKTKMANAAGIQLLHFWDFEIRDKFDVVCNIILSKLGLSNKIYARKTELTNVSYKEASVFLNATHLAGSARAKKYLGLIYNKTLVAVAAFSPNRFKQDDCWELVRYASIGTVVGGLSKLIKFFRKIVNSPLLSFADIRISDGHTYKLMGFEYINQTKPNYFYIKGYKRLHRQQAMKHKLKDIVGEDIFNEKLTEYQIMELAGWLKCSDCGSFKFILR